MFLDTAARDYAKSRAFDTPYAFPGSSVVERRTVNPLVAGSSPARGANRRRPATSEDIRFLAQNGEETRAKTADWDVGFELTFCNL